MDNLKRSTGGELFGSPDENTFQRMHGFSTGLMIAIAGIDYRQIDLSESREEFIYGLAEARRVITEPLHKEASQ